MKYVLVMKNGKTMSFYLKAVAELYQVINGGFIVDAADTVDVVDSTDSTDSNNSTVLKTVVSEV